MLEKYLPMFANHRTDRGRDRYPEITCHRAPHKPFLLLSVMDLIAQGRITKNLIEPSYELVDTVWETVLNRLTRLGYAKWLIGRASGQADSLQSREKGVSLPHFFIDKLRNSPYI